MNLRPYVVEWILEVRPRRGAPHPSVMRGLSEEAARREAKYFEDSGRHVEVIPTRREMSDEEWAASIVARLAEGDADVLVDEAAEWVRSCR